MQYPNPYTANSYATVVDGSSSPADPFGGSGNKSMLVEDNYNADTTYVGWDYNNASAPDIVSGTLKFQLYLSSNGSYLTPYTNVRIGQNGAGSGATSAMLVYFSFPSGAYLNKVAVDVNGVTHALDNAVNFNTIYDVELTFDSVTHTMSGKLNGNPLTEGSTTSWGYSKPLLNAIDSVTFNTGTNSQVGNRVFVDNIVLDAVPEPSMLGLASLGLLGMIRRRHRS
jgi:hypothetical protein